jgi:hypothetical protein
LIVISQSPREWYGSLAPKYLDAAGLFRDFEFAGWLKRTIPHSQQNPKQAVMAPLDQEILQRAASVMDVSDYQSLNPMMFFRVLKRLEGDRELHRLREVLRHEPALATKRRDAAAASGGAYIAVSHDFTNALPDTSANVEFMQTLFARLKKEQRLVVLDSAASLNEQAQVIQRAQAFVGGYGDLAVVSAFHGVPAYAFCSSDIASDQLSLTRALSAEGVWAPVTVQRIEQAADFQLPPHAFASDAAVSR